MKKKLHNLFLQSFIAILLTSNSSAATLEEAIETAKSSNKTIKAEDYKLEVARSLKDEARAAFLPDVSINAQYGQRKSNVRGANNKYGTNKVEELKIDQPLFDGFGSVARYDEAKYKIKSATSQNHNKKREITFDTIRAYCELFRYQEVLKLQENNKKFNNDIYNLVKNRQRKKVVDDSDLIKYQYELSNAETRYFEASSKLMKAKFEYRNVVGEISQDLIFPNIPEHIFDEKATVETVVDNNDRLKSYHFNYLASKSAYKAEKSAFAPSASVVASVSKQKNSLYLADQQFENRSVYLNLSVPLYNKGVEYSNLSKASSQSSAAKEEFEVIKGELIRDVGQTIQEYNFLRKLKNSNEQLVDFAQNRLDIISKRFDAGAEDVVELLRAKIDLNDRRIDLINSQMDLVASYYKIKFFLGEI